MAVVAGDGGEIFSQTHAACHITHHPRTDDRIHAVKIRSLKFLLINIACIRVEIRMLAAFSCKF